MKINIQKWTRVIPCLITIFFVLVASVAPAYAEGVPGRFYTFNEHIKPPEDDATLNELAAGIDFKGTTYEGHVSFTRLQVKIGGLMGLQLRFNSAPTATDDGFGTVASFNVGAILPESTWINRDYQTLYFPSAINISDGVLDWLEANGAFTSEAPLIGLPNIDLDDIFDSDILENEYMIYADTLGIFLRNRVTSPFIFALFGLVFISFVLYGKK